MNVAAGYIERTGLTTSINYYNWYAYQFWRFVTVQQQVAKAAQSLVEFPPMQKGASFNLEQLKDELAKKVAAQAGQ
jgi:arylsulfatase